MNFVEKPRADKTLGFCYTRRMKLTTLNLQGFANWEVREPAIVDYLQATDPDVVLFQEVVYLPEVSPYNQVQLLNQRLAYPFTQSAVTRLQPSPHYDVYREGLGLLSKHPIAQQETVVLKRAPGDEHNRILQLVDMKIGEQVVKIANVHFSLSDTIDYATEHLRETLGILASRGEERIIAGDFNLDSLEASANVWDAQYRASTEVDYISFPADNKRIDYFLIPKSYSFGAIATSGEGLSDHMAVTAEVTDNIH